MAPPLERSQTKNEGEGSLDRKADWLGMGKLKDSVEEGVKKGLDVVDKAIVNPVITTVVESDEYREGLEETLNWRMGRVERKKEALDKDFSFAKADSLLDDVRDLRNDMEGSKEILGNEFNREARNLKKMEVEIIKKAQEEAAKLMDWAKGEIKTIEENEEKNGKATTYLKAQRVIEKIMQSGLYHFNDSDYLISMGNDLHEILSKLDDFSPEASYPSTTERSEAVQGIVRKNNEELIQKAEELKSKIKKLSESFIKVPRNLSDPQNANEYNLHLLAAEALLGSLSEYDTAFSNREYDELEEKLKKIVQNADAGGDFTWR